MKKFSSFEGLTDIETVVKQSLADRSSLDPDELLSILRIAEAGKQSARMISSNQALCPGLNELIKSLSLFEGLAEAIRTSIDPAGAIMDSASPELKRLRRQKTGLRRELQKKLENIKKTIDHPLDGDGHIVSIREGRYVIPLRTDLKSRIDGIIHDYSKTHATCFFEPIEVFQDNNRLAEWAHLERVEEIRILTALTGMVRKASEDLMGAQAILGRLDGLYGRARLSLAMDCVSPIMVRGGGVKLKEARNPLLLELASDGDKPVPVDIFLDKHQNLMIISGPNRGGKTVILKTLGLLSLMAQCGLHIPAAEGSSLPVFQNVLAEIGDDQDIQKGLSTFSAHIKHLKYIAEQADQESLVIIDEPGMGTDPDEGAALAMALLDDLTRKGSLVAVSTHYNRLKTYGLLSERAKNASVEFDASTNRPTFSLCYGTPGTSYAFEVARDSGFSANLLDHARGYLDQDEVRLNRLIHKLNRLKQEAFREKLKAEQSKERYHSAREKLLGALTNLESERRALFDKKTAEADHLIKKARDEFKELINALKNKGEQRQAHVKGRLDQISQNLRDSLSPEETEEESADPTLFRVGQQVYHKGLHQRGAILSLDSHQDKAVISVGNMRLSVNLQDLEGLSVKKELKQPESSGGVTLYGSGHSEREINLIGLRIAEALPLVDKMIDRAVVNGEFSVRIIHGYGTGKLKAAIRDRLRQSSCVKKICGGEPQSGGEGVTVVEL